MDIKKTDLIFAGITGFSVAFIFIDFLTGTNFEKYAWHLFWLFPILSIICLQISDLIGKKASFVHQAAKFFLVGALSAVVDIKVYQFSAWIFGLLIIISPLASKSISFLVATLVKYGGNKIWVFEKNGKDGIKKEVIQFFVITFIGLVIDVGAFWYFTKVMGPQFSMQTKIWEELSIVFAALAAAIWNFLGYKFWVFKK